MTSDPLPPLNPAARDEILRLVDEYLADENCTAVARAKLMVDIVRRFYDHVKFEAPEGHGLDKTDGPERSGLGRALDAAQFHHDDVMERYFGIPQAQE